MKRTTFKIDKMDCSAEQTLIRMQLQDIATIERLDFDLKTRTLTIFHTADSTGIAEKLQMLNLNAHLIDSLDSDNYETVLSTAHDNKVQRKSLCIVLIINLAFFFIEMSTGLISRSMGLVADSLDMLADAFIYGISLYVVGASILRKKRVAKFSGYFQISLAILGFAEVIKRAVGIEEIPQFQTMIVVSILALLANATSLYILQKTKNKEAHIQASVICSSNDIIINAGVILAGVFVWLLDSKIPDLVIGSIVFVIVIRGATRILKLSK